MHMLSFIVWNVNPEIFPIGPLSLRWYGLLFASAFIFGYWMSIKFFGLRDRFGEKFVDKWLMYGILGTVIGARLGHVLFYDFSYYMQHPLEIVAVWKGGLASHGAAIGLLIAMYLFSKKYKVSFLMIMDILVIIVAAAGFFIRTGNLMNSEIYGQATNSKYGFIYVHDAVEAIKKDELIAGVSFRKINCDSMIQKKYVPLQMTLRFERGLTDTSVIRQYTNMLPGNILAANPEKEIIAAGNKAQIIGPEPGKRFYQAIVPVLGIPKHPTHIYEALFCILLFVLLSAIYKTQGDKLKPGTIMGWFVFLLFIFRFLVEFIKNIQSDFEASMTLNMGQILSIPFILLGLGLLLYNRFKKV
jgi:phosphatidylglycerol---prolipoprotein diacylglyceryl transferase